MFILSSVIPDFWKTFGYRWKGFFSYLGSAALFPSCAIIFENKSNSLGITWQKNHPDYKQWKFIPFVKEFVYENSLLLWFQDLKNLKMRYGFLGVQLWDLTSQDRYFFWNELFYILRFKETKKGVGPKWCWVNTNWYTNILFEKYFTNRVTKHLFMRKDKALTRVYLVKYLLPAPLEDQ